MASFWKKVKKTFNKWSGTIIGGALFGIPGLIVGFLGDKAKQDAYENAKKSAQRGAQGVADRYKAYFYEHVPQLGLELDMSIAYDAAENYGLAKQAKNWGYHVSAFFLKAAVIVVVTIISIAVTILSAGTASAASVEISLMVIGAVISATSAGISQYQAYKATKLAAEARKFAADAGIKRAINDAKERGKKLTSHLIKHPYAICADGSIYKQGLAGSKTYEPLTPPDPTRGIYGLSLTDENTQLNAQITNKAHISKAGNATYFNSILGTDEIDIVSVGFDWTQPMRVNEDRMKKLNEKQLEFFQEFQDVGKLNYSERFNGWVDSQSKKLRKFFIARIVNDDFLNKNQYYQKGEKLPMFEQLAPLLSDIKKIPLEFASPTWGEARETAEFMMPIFIKQLERKIEALPADINIAEVKAFREKVIDYDDFKAMEKKLKDRLNITTSLGRVTYRLAYDDAKWETRKDENDRDIQYLISGYATLDSEQTRKIGEILLPFDKLAEFDEDTRDFWDYIIITTLEKMGYEAPDDDDETSP